MMSDRAGRVRLVASHRVRASPRSARVAAHTQLRHQRQEHRRVTRLTRCDQGHQRQAVAVALTAVGVVSLALLVLASFVKAPVERIMFEVISAFATAGLSTGLTAQMPPAGQMIIILVMYVGRVGIISLAAILAVPSRYSPIRYPEEKPIVG